ncbi:lipid IV(A) 3-deoxy-D-manno-octulosonic acid transferase [Cupriavidus plantarum]|uniref:lipid IV(A) 3-deoxy-D-manno-octulosonic acid transferase n=1 Tax=Cupriavidus plantarum TaxID=942865 RepID=UPI00339D641B
MLRLVYTLLWVVILPFALLRLLWRARKEPGYVHHVGERLGIYDDVAGATAGGSAGASAGNARWLWVHAVSVGETRAAQPLVEALLAAHPDHRVLLTHMTPTGRQTGHQLFGENPRVRQCYVPYDVPWLVRRFLRHFRPEAALLMETEVWPNLVHGTRAAGIPLYLVNARLSPRSYRRTARFGRAASEIYQNFTEVLAQTPGDAERYRALGMTRVSITGNLKFDMQPPEALLARGKTLRRAMRAASGERPVLAAASTREGEEAMLLDAFIRWPGETRPTLLLVPRHPQRFDEVAALGARLGFTVRRRSAMPIDAGVSNDAGDNDTRSDAHSDARSDATPDIVLGDSMGEMPMYFAASDLAFIGGSLMPLGGQNLIEACACGTPVLIGPHTFNFAQATEDAIAAGACERVDNADVLMTTAARILADRAALAEMRANALNFAGMHRGATARTISTLAPALR